MVLKRERFAIGHAKAPVDGERVGEWRERGVERGTKLRRVNGFVVIAALVWGADGVEHIATRARAGENRARGVEAGERGAIQRETLALGDDRFFPSET